MMKLDRVFNNDLNPQPCGPLTPFGLDQQRKIREMELKAAVMEERERNSMKNKLCKIAELFEMDVLSEEEALKACNTVIQQHAKVKGMAINGSDSAKL